MSPLTSAGRDALADVRNLLVLMTATLLVSLMLFPSAARAGVKERMPEPSSHQIEGHRHQGPRAYHAMCARDPKLCMHDRLAGRRAGVSPAAPLSRERWDELNIVNDWVNQRVSPAEDYDLHGKSDHWSLAGRFGDCEDYMITKKQLLIEAGWAADQLLYAVVEGVETPYHAVLIVRTSRGDYVLDNLHGEIRPWQDSGYRFVIRQSVRNPHSWVHVQDLDLLSQSDYARISATR